MQILVWHKSKQLSWYHMGRANGVIRSARWKKGKKNLDNVIWVPRACMPEAIALGFFCYMSYFQLYFCHLRSNLRKISLPGVFYLFGDWESEGNSHTKNKVFKTSSGSAINNSAKKEPYIQKQIWELWSDHREPSSFLSLPDDNV